MLRKSVAITVLTVAVVGLAAVAWAGAASPGWEPGQGSMMGNQGADRGSWGRDSGSGMAGWMERMHERGPGIGDEGLWEDMAAWMTEHHAARPSVCPHWRYASSGVPAG